MNLKFISIFILSTIVLPTAGLAQTADTLSLQRQLLGLLQQLLELYIRLEVVSRAPHEQYIPTFFTPQPIASTDAEMRVYSPNGGEEFIAGTEVRIGWRKSTELKDNAVEIDLVDQYGTLVMIIEDYVESRKSSYLWKIPLELGYRGGKYRILVSSLPSGRKGAHDFSDGSFTIVLKR
jgi:hypothetical protein